MKYCFGDMMPKEALLMHHGDCDRGLGVDSCTEEPKCCSRPKKALVRTAPGSPAHLVSIQESRDPGPN